MSKKSIFLTILFVSVFLFGFEVLTAFATHGREASGGGNNASANNAEAVNNTSANNVAAVNNTPADNQNLQLPISRPSRPTVESRRPLEPLKPNSESPAIRTPSEPSSGSSETKAPEINAVSRANLDNGNSTKESSKGGNLIGRNSMERSSNRRNSLEGDSTEGNDLVGGRISRNGTTGAQETEENVTSTDQTTGNTTTTLTENGKKHKGWKKEKCPPKLTITKEAEPPSGSTVGRGDLIPYTLNFENTGPGCATEVVITDRVPSGTTLVPDSITGGGVESGGVITWDIGNVPAGDSGQVSFIVTVDNDVPSGTVIPNFGTIDSKETKCIKSNRTEHVVVVPDLFVEKDGPDTASPGEEITYTINYGNSSEDDATGVIITDTLPEHVIVADPGGGTVFGDTITWVIGDLGGGESGSITFKLRVDSPMPEGTTILTNCAKISGNEEESDPFNNEDCVDTEVTMVLIPPAGIPPREEVAPPKITLVAAPAEEKKAPPPAEETKASPPAEETEGADVLPVTGFNFSWLLVGFGLIVLGIASRRWQVL